MPQIVMPKTMSNEGSASPILIYEMKGNVPPRSPPTFSYKRQTIVKRTSAGYEVVQSHDMIGQRRNTGDHANDT